MEVYRDRYPGYNPIGGGFSSQCLRDERRVIKVIRVGSKEKRAVARLGMLSDEYGQMRAFLDTHALETDFRLGNYSGEWIIEIGQQYIDGAPLRKSLDARNPAQRDFFQRSLKMYNQTGLVPDLVPDIMPDLSGGIYINGRYTYRSGPNVLLVEGSPVLVDTTLSRSLRNKAVGPVLRFLVARKIERILR